MSIERLVEAARTSWVDIKPSIDERVLEAVRKVDRAQFLPSLVRSLAYHDSTVNWAGSTISTAPSLVALMANLLELEGGLEVLHIGTGCGYSAAMIGHLIGIPEGVGRLTTVEILSERANLAKENLRQHFGNLNRIEVVVGDGRYGDPRERKPPYQRIVYFAGVPTGNGFKERVLSQLDDGGILLFPDNKHWSLVLLRKSSGGVIERTYGQGKIILIQFNVEVNRVCQ